jgi:hypothetical protein
MTIDRDDEKFLEWLDECERGGQGVFRVIVVCEG